MSVQIQLPNSSAHFVHCNTYGLVSLYAMLKFAAQDFWEASQILAEMRSSPEAIYNAGKREAFQKSFVALINHCRNLNLPVTMRELQKMNDRPDDGQDHMAEDIARLGSIIHSELDALLFFNVPAYRAGYYDQKELFGVDVNSKFPSVQYDMVEAGNCYALGRGTACVFHLMRVMEVGVQQFGTKLGVTLVGAKNWQNILDELNKAIRALRPHDPDIVATSQVSANLYAVKLAWRNEVMHPNDTYTLEEAEDILRQVKMFMANLAAII